MADSIEVYGLQASAPTRVVLMTAEVLKVDYIFKKVDIFKGENKTPEYLAINQHHNIPAMVDGGFKMNESKAISAYLANKIPGGSKIYPTDPVVRASVEQKLYFDEGTFYKALMDILRPILFEGSKPEADKYTRLHEVLGWVNGFVADGKFVAGTDTLTLADIAFLSTYSTLRATKMTDLTKYQDAEAWFNKLVKLIPNYQFANGEGAAFLGGFFQSKNKA